jgi:hypothetical protein
MGLPAEASDGPQGPRDSALPERTEHSGWDQDDIRSAKTKRPSDRVHRGWLSGRHRPRVGWCWRRRGMLS